jgi:hypothetical protein
VSEELEAVQLGAVEEDGDLVNHLADDSAIHRRDDRFITELPARLAKAQVVQLPQDGRDMEWPRRSEGGLAARPADQRQHPAAPTGFEPVSPP